MHNRQLQDALAAFAEEAAWQLADETSAGAEVPFEVVEAEGRRRRETPLYCYRPLTARFIDDRLGLLGRLPTFLLNLEGVPATKIANTLGERGYGVWAHDSWYSLGLREKLPYPEEALRVGLIHYNTADEIDGFLRELGSFA